jgi:hypothetical protein
LDDGDADKRVTFGTTVLRRLMVKLWGDSRQAKIQYEANDARTIPALDGNALRRVRCVKLIDALLLLAAG